MALAAPAIGKRRKYGSVRLISGRSAVIAVTVLVLIYLVLVPVGFLVYGSFSTGRPGIPGVLTFHTYAEILGAQATWFMIWRSLLYGVGSAVVALAIGGTLAWLVQRTDMPGRKIATFVILFPMFMPEVLAVLAWQELLDKRIGVINVIAEHLFGVSNPIFSVQSLPGMIWVTGAAECPLIFLWLLPAFAVMDPSLEEAGSISGRSPMRVLTSVTLPLLRPAILAAFMISLVLSLEDVVVPVLIGDQANITVLSNSIYNNVETVPGNDNAASVEAVILLLMTFALVMWNRRLTSRSERYVTVSGKGFRPKVISLGRLRVPAACGVAAILAVIVGVPFLILIWTSLTPYVATPSWSGLHHLTSEWYRSLFTNHTLVEGLRGSALVSVASTAIVLVLALVTAWVLVRSRYRFKRALDLLSFAPIAIPGIVLGFSLIWVYLQLPAGVYGTWYILIIAYVTRFIPFGVRLVSTGFVQLSPELDEAAAISGSGWGKVLRSISLPLLWPAILASMIYVFVRSFTELSASLMLFSTNTQPYSVVAFSLWSGGQVGLTAAYGLLGMVVMAVPILILQALSRRSFVSGR